MLIMYNSLYFSRNGDVVAVSRWKSAVKTMEAEGKITGTASSRRASIASASKALMRVQQRRLSRAGGGSSTSPISIGR